MESTVLSTVHNQRPAIPETFIKILSISMVLMMLQCCELILSQWQTNMDHSQEQLPSRSDMVDGIFNSSGK